jgi:multiple sugar transport system ATP-binding protein
VPSLAIRNIVKDYGVFRAIKDVSFTAEPGEFIVMVGPSGCGKSTLLRSIAGLESITSGSIDINGRDVTHQEPANRGVAMVFQNYALYPHMTVAENMGFALKIAGRPKAEVARAVTHAAEVLRITEHLGKKPKQLSGGQKQRVAIGRAITRSPEIFLFDEPLSNLDAALRSQMRVELGRLHAELKATMVYVTHDQTEAMTMASRIVVLNDGRVEQIGTSLELYNRPANRFVAGFLGSPRMNFIAARVRQVSGRVVSVAAEGVSGVMDLPVDADRPVPGVGDKVTLGIRPEGFGSGTGAGWRIAARVSVIESLGRETLVYADASPLNAFDSESAEGFFAIHRANQIEAAYNDPIVFSIHPDVVYLFDASGNTLRHPVRAGDSNPGH